MAAEDSQSAQNAADSAEQTEPSEQQTQPGADSDSQNVPPVSTPPLNREQRRAQAKGKKGGPTGVNPAQSHFNNRANSNSRPGTSVEKRLPRTGHK